MLMMIGAQGGPELRLAGQGKAQCLKDRKDWGEGQ